jgi:hypothetical protein
MPIEYAENPNWWDRMEAKAKEMTSEALYGAICDIHKTLPCADTMDRVNGTDSGGRYRDEISVYRAEIMRRLKENNFCDHCGK